MGIGDWWRELVTGRRRALFGRIQYEYFPKGQEPGPVLMELHKRIYQHHTDGDILLQEVNPVTKHVLENDAPPKITEREGSVLTERAWKVPVRKGNMNISILSEKVGGNEPRFTVTTHLMPKEPKPKPAAMPPSRPHRA